MLGGALTALVLVVALITYLLVRSEPYVAPAPSGTVSRPDPAGAGHALQQLQDAVTSRDLSAAAGLAPGGDPAASDLLTAVVANADALHVGGFTVRYVDDVGAVDPQGRWQAAVDFTWRFDGFDRDPVHEEVLVGFELEQGGSSDDAVGITSFGGGDRHSPLWLSGPVEVRRSATSLVLATTAANADLLAGRADAAGPVVRDLLPHWDGKLVVEVPASEEGLDAELAADPGTYTDIAAVTASVDGTVAPDSELHVFVNPDVYDDLEPVGGQVVISHEATHLATRAPLTSGVPLWLLEGFADYVALHAVDLPISTTAGQIIQQVRKDGAPDHLPGQPEFDQSDSHLGAAYESAWVACLVLADAGGQDAVVRLYEQVSRGRDLDGQLHQLFGLTEAELTTRWRQRLLDLAARSTDGT
ncbi:MAG: hypothetical protein QOD98_3642 [Nocardioidaceae bacterium]|nr:hypothetical protein [Nocardioidaceae bacterium]